MINRESARTVAKLTPASGRPTPRKSQGAATASEQMGSWKLAQYTNFTQAEQIGGGCGAASERVRRNANLSAVRRRNESKCQKQP